MSPVPDERRLILLPAVDVVEGRAVGKTKTGNLLDARATWVWTVRDGLATANHNYHDTDAWRHALTP